MPTCALRPDSEAVLADALAAVTGGAASVVGSAPGGRSASWTTRPWGENSAEARPLGEAAAASRAAAAASAAAPPPLVLSASSSCDLQLTV